MLRSSRRGFLLAGGAVALLSADPLKPEPVGCSLPESERGYQSACASSAIRVLPAASAISGSAVLELRAFVEQGGFVLFESGAGFAGPEIFKRQQALFRSAFGVSLLPPISLWNEAHPPYVEYRWPVNASVRDFSRAIAIEPDGGGVIASVGSIPIAILREIGAGSLVFLGSPLGPHLLAGDPDASRWFTALERTAALPATRRMRPQRVEII